MNVGPSPMGKYRLARFGCRAVGFWMGRGEKGDDRELEGEWSELEGKGREGIERGKLCVLCEGVSRVYITRITSYVLTVIAIHN